MRKRIRNEKNRVLRKIRYFIRKFQLLESRNKLPPSKKLADAAKCLNVSVRYLEYGDEQTKKPTAQGGELISDLPENIQKLISICLQNPDFTVLLLDLAQRMQNPPADPA